MSDLQTCRQCGDPYLLEEECSLDGQPLELCNNCQDLFFNPCPDYFNWEN